MKFYERKRRSVIKSVSYRVLIIIADIIIVYWLTRRYDFTAGVVIFTNIASSVIYFFHERIWNNISWGKQKGR